MIFLVVPDLSEVIAIWRSKIAFKRVDFPTLGRPTILTNPDFINYPH